jgi:hypothetical protein
MNKFDLPTSAPHGAATVPERSSDTFDCLGCERAPVVANAGAPLPPENPNITLCGWCNKLLKGDQSLYADALAGRIVPSTGICDGCKEKFEIRRRALLFQEMIKGNLDMAREALRLNMPGMAERELSQALTKFEEAFKTL